MEVLTKYYTKIFDRTVKFYLRNKVTGVTGSFTLPRSKYNKFKKKFSRKPLLIELIGGI